MEQDHEIKNVTVVKHRPSCDLHPEAEAARNERHDAYYCGPCDRWLESPCHDAACGFCVGRPEKPSAAG